MLDWRPSVQNLYLSGGVVMANTKIFTGNFPSPPEGFSPLEASDEMLVSHGFPPRPVGSPELLKHWEQMMGGEVKYVQPEFRRMEGVRHGLPLLGTGGPGTSSNWSGAVYDKHFTGSFSKVNGTWTVPTVLRPQPEVEAHCSSWVGFDNGPAIFQAGSHSIVGSSGATSQYLWWEWFPDAEIAITNVPVEPGHRVTCFLTATSSNTGTVWLYNETIRLSTSFAVAGSPQIERNMVEWIVERPSINGIISHLPNYGEVSMSPAYAEPDGQVGDATLLDMVNDNRLVISKASYIGLGVKTDYVPIS
jgi:hypothetical protein